MPIYRYQCSSCKHEWEELWGSFKEAEELEPLLKCPECQTVKPSRLMGTPTTNFKGTGWTPKGPSRTYDSTQGIKDHAKQIREDAKKITSKDLYGEVPKKKVFDAGKS